MLTIDKNHENFLYQQVTQLIAHQIDLGTLRPGDRLPSLRQLSNSLNLSLPTVKQGYQELERRGLVESRPQSGFYVLGQQRNLMIRMARRRVCKPAEVRCRPLIEQVHEGLHRAGNVPLGIANPSMARPAAKALHRAMKRVMARAEERSLGYAPVTGEPGLRRQLAFRYLDSGGNVDPDDVLITNGAQEALTIALMAVAHRGDVIAVESPTYFGLLELIESLGMLALEIETSPVTGVSCEALHAALNSYDIKACMFTSAVNNPLGSVTTDEHRQLLVAMLEERGIPLIEDDVYGDLVFDGPRPTPSQFFSRNNLVLTCGSFSKTVAPGYRIGWLLPGRYSEVSHRLKRALSCSSGLLQQMTLGDFISTGDYERQLKTLRGILKQNSERMRALIANHFPDSTRVSQPRGGSVLWLELPKSNSAPLFERALEQGISLCPGMIFSPTGRYQNFIRLSFGLPWNETLENAIRKLGEIVSKY
jgi:DNA-binding transcriptional MocR family regulator